MALRNYSHEDILSSGLILLHDMLVMQQLTSLQNCYDGWRWFKSIYIVKVRKLSKLVCSYPQLLCTTLTSTRIGSSSLPSSCTANETRKCFHIPVQTVSSSYTIRRATFWSQWEQSDSCRPLSVIEIPVAKTRYCFFSKFLNWLCCSTTRYLAKLINSDKWLVICKSSWLSLYFHNGGFLFLLYNVHLLSGYEKYATSINISQQSLEQFLRSSKAQFKIGVDKYTVH